MPQHVIITGTGRAGTTFLMQLFTGLGLPTGYKDVMDDVLTGEQNCGMEVGLTLKKGLPYFVKSPFFCTQIDDAVEQGMIINNVIVPIRNLKAAVDSRKRVGKVTNNIASPGGIYGVRDFEKQEEYILKSIYQLFLSIAKHDLPVILLSFPRLVLDVNYLYKKIRPVLHIPGKDMTIDFDQFKTVFTQLSKPELVHFND